MLPDSLIDLAGSILSAEDLLAALLDTAPNPTCVVDPDDVFRFVNPAAVSALGYDRAEELLGRQSHDTIHYQHPDGRPYPAEDCPLRVARTRGEAVTSDLDRFFRRDGSSFGVSFATVPIEMSNGRGAVVAFVDIEDQLRAEQMLREQAAQSSAREESLLRIAGLVAGGAGSADVLAAIAREVGHVVGVPVVGMWRFEPDGVTATVIGAWSNAAHPYQTGTRWPVDPGTVLARVLSTGRTARIDDYTDIPGTVAGAVRDSGFRASAGAPILVAGEVWGAMTAGVRSVGLPDHLEDRLSRFTELVATAIANTASRDQLARLADEQAALRRVATLVARGTRPDEVFASVADEAAGVLSVDFVNIGRYDDSDGTITLVASARERLPIGTRWPVAETSFAQTVFRTGRPAHTDDYRHATGRFAEATRADRIRSAVATPIVVEGRLWGLMAAANGQEQPLPPDAEVRLASFTELVVTAIANAEARAEVAASRARIVTATDTERRRVIRDLHDGAQQRLVQTVFTLKLARRALQEGRGDLSTLLVEALDHGQLATEELRELAHGILPAVLTQRGLRAGVDALASRTPVPVENAVSVGRLPPAVESTAYFVISEALTNVAKHAHAQHVEVTAWLEHGTLAVHVQDDGVGGARPDGGGLIGLADRLAALDGQLRVDSPLNGGTLVAAEIPVRE